MSAQFVNLSGAAFWPMPAIGGLLVGFVVDTKGRNDLVNFNC